MEISPPSWFLENCLKTYDELKKQPDTLIIRNASSYNGRVPEEDSSLTTYEIEPALYEPLRAVVREDSRLSKLSRKQNDLSRSVHFTHDALLLLFPNSEPKRMGSSFLLALVEHFAQSIGANLMTLTLDTIKDLVEYYAKPKDDDQPFDIDHAMETSFRNSRTTKVGYQGIHTLFRDVEDASYNPTGKHDDKVHKKLPEGLKIPSPFHALLSSPLTKQSAEPATGIKQHNPPLVICLMGVYDIFNACNGNIIKSLRSATCRRTAYTRNIIIIATDLRDLHQIYSDSTTTDSSESSQTSSDYTTTDKTRDSGSQGGTEHTHDTVNDTEERDSLDLHRTYSDSATSDLSESSQISLDRFIVSNLGSKPMKQTIFVVPVNSEAQRKLISLDGLTSYRPSNIKALQKVIRGRSKEGSNMKMLQPLAKWSFLDDSQAGKFLEENELSAEDIDEILREIGDNFSSENIERLVVGFCQRRMLLQAWVRNDQIPVSDGKWSHFSPEIQEVIQKIEEDEDKYKFEAQFLDLLVHPRDIEECWSDVALDSEIEEAVKLIIPHANSASNLRPAYGILKKSRIGGALLYGPPGTGKTQLARVLARESKAVTICASGADLESMWVGETEKGIKALFRLGSLLSPCIIFIDEADALFRARRPEDRSYERNRTNQLLAEMDGLRRSKTAAFVLLATNFPHDLDHAILRRVPSRFHIGLPTTALRTKIFEINLREEVLDSSIDLVRLADMTYGYSGSDIQTLCVQAALACNSFSVKGEDAGKRILAHSHFEKAFRRVSPTVSAKALTLIQDFAKDSDPVAYETMLAIEQQEREIHERAVGLKYDPLNPDENQIRLLSIDEDPDRTQIDQSTLSCTLETVKLDDCTAQYLKFKSSWTDSRETAEESSTEGSNERELNSVLAAWIDLGRLKNSKISPLNGPGDESGIYLQAVDNRFNWGDYLALSYVWGDQAVKRRILVNKRPFEVALNLYYALLKLRSSFEVKQRKLKIWVDAICINQSDLDERSRVIRKMNIIYSEALCVRGWVGHPSPEVASMLPTIRSLMDGRLRHSSFIDSSSVDLEDDDSAMDVIDQDTMDSVRTVACSLVEEEYWERLWIVQEMVLASSIIFWYGDSLFSPEEVVKLFSLSPVSRASDQEKSKIILRLDKIGINRRRMMMLRQDIRREWTTPEHDPILPSLPSLCKLIFLAQTSKATDQRDKIYSLLSLLPSSISSSIRPSYDASIDAVGVYTQFSSVCIQEQGDLDLLVLIPNYTSRPKGLPSWAFNFEMSSASMFDGDPLVYWKSGRKTVDHLGNSFPVDSSSQFNANGGINSLATFSADMRILTCEGLLVDTITGLGPRFTDEDEIEDLHKMTQHATTYSKDSSSHSVNAISRLSVARLLMHDTKYEFCQGPSILDMHWMSAEELESKTNSPLENPYTSISLRHLFQYTLYPNAEFKLGGIPLKEYFPSSPDPGPSLERHPNIINASYSFNHRRFFTGKDGLVGTVNTRARLGDRIAVILGCTMPVVLRCRGDCYQFIGSCFAEGLMDGEAVQGVEDGRVETQEISLC